MRSARLLCAGLVLGAAATVFADKGDLFLSAAPVVDAVASDPAFGFNAGLQIGANEATDFLLETDVTFSEADAGTSVETRILLGSMLTLFSGDFRPRFGGSGGVVVINAPEGVEEAYLNLGAHFQGLYDASDRLRLFAEVHPNFTFGTHGEFSTLVKAGILFRLSK